MEEIIVIGSGISGLSVATCLAHAGKKVTIGFGLRGLGFV